MNKIVSADSVHFHSLFFCIPDKCVFHHGFHIILVKLRWKIVILQKQFRSFFEKLKIFQPFEIYGHNDFHFLFKQNFIFFQFLYYVCIFQIRQWLIGIAVNYHSKIIETFATFFRKIFDLHICLGVWRKKNIQFWLDKWEKWKRTIFYA